LGDLDKIKNPPRAFSPLAFWFLNGKLEPGRLRQQIGEMADKGVYGAFLHARASLKTPYLEGGWWEAIATCVDEAKRLGFSPWLYDEYAWPSGTAGSTFPSGHQKPSRVLAEGERNMAKGLSVKIYEPGSLRSEASLWGNEKSPLAAFAACAGDIGSAGDAACAGDIGDIGPSAVTNDSACVGEGYRRLSIEGSFPENARVIAFYRDIYPQHVDYMNKSAIRSFLQYTHEAYKKRFGDSFGTLIPGIFFDEIYMAGAPLPWSDLLPGAFAARNGYDLLGNLPYLIEGEGRHAKKVRRDYYGTIAALYEEAFFQQIASWCAENRLQLTGHTEEELSLHPARQGDYFRTIRHLQVPGADCHDYRYRFPRAITYHEPKYAVSVARANGQERCLSEAMGGAGWGCSLQEFKRGVNTLGAMGVNMLCLHGFYYECDRQGAQADWPTSFFTQNPYWKYFKIFADYMSRICYLNAVGQPVVAVGLYYPIRAVQENTVAGRPNSFGDALCESFNDALAALIENQIDADMIDPDSLLRAQVSEGRLCVGAQRFRAIAVPLGVELSEEEGVRLRAFADAGGLVVFYSPGGRPVAGFSDCPACAVCAVDRLPATLHALFDTDVLVTSGDRRGLYASHRLIDSKSCYFLTNGTDHSRMVTVRLRGEGPVAGLDPESGDWFGVRYGKAEIEGTGIGAGAEGIEGFVTVSLDLHADQACWLVCGAGHEATQPSAGTPGADTEPSAGTPGADTEASAGTPGAVTEPSAGTPGVGTEPSAGTPGADTEASAGMPPCGIGLSSAEQINVPSRWFFLPLGKAHNDAPTDGAPVGDAPVGDVGRTALDIPLCDFTDSVRSGMVQRIRIRNTDEEPGRCGRHLSLWRSGWLARRPSWHGGEFETDLYFRKELWLAGTPEAARFCVAAINAFTLYVNGREVTDAHDMHSTGQPFSAGQPVTIDAAPYLRAGSNLIAVHVHIETPGEMSYTFCDILPRDRLTSLLFQGEIVWADGAKTHIGDDGWIVSNLPAEGWTTSDAKFEIDRLDHAALAKGFWQGAPDGAWLPAWVRGRPPLLPWGDLPLFGQRFPYPVTLCYGVTLPAGTAYVAYPDVSGRSSAHEVSFRLDGLEVVIPAEGLALVPEDIPRRLDILVEASSPDDGLRAPVRVDVKPFRAALGDWRLHGLPWFSGRARYQTTLPVDKKEGRYWLDIGSPTGCAEMWVNGHLAAVRLWPPYRADVTRLLKDGVNEITVVIANSAAVERRHMLVDEGMALGWNRYWNEDNIDREGENLTSGLLGPVRIYRA